MRRFICLFFIVSLLSGCEQKKHNGLDPDFYYVKMLNNSGVAVEVYNSNDDRGEFPERLMLVSGSSYTWKIKKDAASPLTEDMIRRVSIFFSPFYLEYGGSENKEDIDPRWFENYERTEKDGVVFYEYAFTKERYQEIAERHKPSYIKYKCVMENKSGVKVAFETRVTDSYGLIDFPEKLVLLPGEKFEWSFTSVKSMPLVESKNSPIWPTYPPFGDPWPDKVKITFGEDVVVEAGSSIYRRDPREIRNYVKEVIDEDNEVYTYTFTEADYRDALNQSGE